MLNLKDFHMSTLAREQEIAELLTKEVRTFDILFDSKFLHLTLLNSNYPIQSEYLGCYQKITNDFFLAISKSGLLFLSPSFLTEEEETKFRFRLDKWEFKKVEAPGKIFSQGVETHLLDYRRRERDVSHIPKS